MNSENRSRNRRLAVEGLVIVVSILLAFALDAWWDETDNRRDLRGDLAGVASELEANRSRILFHVDLMERMTVAGDSVLSAMQGLQEGSVVSLPDTVMWLIGNYPTFNPSLGAVDALIASGRLGLIEDPALLTGLVGIRDQIADAVEEQDRALTLYYDHVLPVVASDPRWPPADRTFQSAILEFWTTAREPGRGLPSFGMVDVPVRREWLRFQDERMRQYRISVGEMLALQARLDSMASLIERDD